MQSHVSKKGIFIFSLVIGFGLSFASPLLAQSGSSLTIQTNQQVGTAHSLLFGITQAPNSNLGTTVMNDAWNKIDQVGITMVRSDYFIDNLAPSYTLISGTPEQQYQAYLSSSVSNISTWNQGSLNYRGTPFVEAKKKGMSTLGIVDYAPDWLTYSGSVNGVPKNWLIWQDLVKKVHSRFMSNIDYVEIWNEPNLNQFLTISDSPYTSPAAAYIDIFKNTHPAIRAIDPDVKIGGPAGYRYSDEAFLRAILADPYVRNNLDFVSVHSYPSAQAFTVSSVAATKKVLSEYGLQNLPIMVSEWNYDANLLLDKHTEPAGISFIGRSLLDFWRNGVISSHYYRGTPNSQWGQKSMYKINNTTVDLLPPTRAFQVASVGLGLGNGNGKILQSTASGNIDGIGFITADNKLAAYLTNDTTSSQSASILFQNLPQSANYTVKYFEGSGSNTGVTPYKTETKTSQNGSLILSVTLPATSVQGVLLEGSTTPTPTPTLSCRADINKSGLVDLGDYGILVADFFRGGIDKPLLNPRSDISGPDKNGVVIVDLLDYSLLRDSFFGECPEHQ